MKKRINIFKYFRGFYFGGVFVSPGIYTIEPPERDVSNIVMVGVNSLLPPPGIYTSERLPDGEIADTIMVRDNSYSHNIMGQHNP